MPKISKHLNVKNLIEQVCKCFDEIPDYRPNHCANGIPFSNFPKSAFAMMHQKYDSLLTFDSDRADPVLAHNLETMYHVQDQKVPCDTRMRDSNSHKLFKRCEKLKINNSVSLDSQIALSKLADLSVKSNTLKNGGC